MQHNRQLTWVMANRTRRDRTRQAGAAVLGLVDGALTAATEERGRLAATLAQHVDQEFLRHCRLSDVRGGAVFISVDEPGLVSAMRMRWAASLEAALRTYRSSQAAHRVTFEFGRSGAPLEDGATE